MHTAAAVDPANLIRAMRCRCEDESGSFVDASDVADAKLFDVVDVHAGDRVVTSTLRGPRIELRRRFEIDRHSPLLRARIEVRCLDSGGEFKLLAMPRVELAEDFADAFEDDRDLYCDGAELGDGRELPCWRVLFRAKPADNGLILATRSKEQMGHLQIMARAFEFYPHAIVAYDTDTLVRIPPFKPTRGKRFVTEFEIGPWTRPKHRAIVRAAMLEAPVGGAVRSSKTSASIRRAAKQTLKGKILYAHRFAPSSATSKSFRRDRWMVTKLPWARGGKILVAGAGVIPPPIVLKPKLKGTYRIFVGIGNGAGVQVKLDGEPESIFRLTPGELVFPTPFHFQLSGKHRAAEVNIGTAKMDDRSLRLMRFPDRHAMSMIDYVRFETLSPAQERKWNRTRDAKLRIPISGMSDVPDIAPLTDSLDPSPEAYRAVIWEHARCGLHRIHWRIDGQCSDYPSKLNTMRYISAKVHSVYTPQSKAYGRALRKWDMLKLAVETARRYGVELYGWMRFNAYMGNVQSDFFKNNRATWEHWEHGWVGGKLCLAFPEVRKHKIDILVEAAGYGLDGLNLGFLRHTPVLHYHPILVDGFRAKYGVEPPRANKDPDDIHRQTLPESDGDYPRWYQYRADFMTLFGRELRQALRDANLGHVKISAWVRPNHALFDGIDVDAWLNEGLCDEIIADGANGPDAHLAIGEPTPQWRAKVQPKAKLYRGIWHDATSYNKQNIPRFIREGYDGLNIYESNMCVLDNRFIELLDSLRR